MSATEYDEGYPATEDGGDNGGAPAQRRERSKIAFPYGDLAGAIEVAQAISHYGLDCDAGQLAAQLDLTSGGGMFRLRVSSAQHFDLIESSAGGRFALTPLGRRIIDPAQQAGARVEAFLSVPLYEHIYDLFDGTVLPNDHGLEAEMVKAGVAQKQVSKARQAFARSADQAGFFAAGRNRLVKPGVARLTSEPKKEPEHKHGKEGDPLSDPMLAGLLRRMLPAEGTEFSARDRRLFFTALAVNLDVIYGSPSDGQIDADEVAKLYKLTTAKSETPPTPAGTHG